MAPAAAGSARPADGASSQARLLDGGLSRVRVGCDACATRISPRPSAPQPVPPKRLRSVASHDLPGPRRPAVGPQPPARIGAGHGEQRDQSVLSAQGTLQPRSRRVT
jgi:hypothetical protein